MTRNIYALLVGIDNYPAPVNPLRGCINDVVAVEEYLRGCIAKEGFKLHIKILKNHEATRDAIVTKFREHLCQASSDDVAFFYYSGHGSQEISPQEFWELEPDKLDETLVCWDSRLEGGWDLADKELAKLIGEVAQKNPHITIILDSCHSGSGTRDPMLETGVRRVPTDKRHRPIDSFIFTKEEVVSLTRSISPDENPSGWNLPQGRHILLAACRDNEEAKEYYGGGQHRGVFCYFLTETLKQINGNLTYRDLFKRINANVKIKVTAQSPQLETIDVTDLDRPFLGGAIASHPPYFTIYHHPSLGWVMDGGAIHGIPAVEGNETTSLAIFPLTTQGEELRQLSSKIGEALVKQVLPQLSQIQISGIDVPIDSTFKAVITSLPLPPKGVRFEGEIQGIQLLRQALKNNPGENKALYLQEVNQAEKVEFRVIARNGQYLITRPADDRPLVGEVESYSINSATKVVERLEHIARWTNIAELAHPATSRIAPDAVNMEIYQDNQILAATQLRLEYRKDSTGQWISPTFKVRLTNTSNQPLYCTLLDLTDRFAVTGGFFPAGGVWLQPEEQVWAYDNRPIPASVPQELWERGVTEVKDILKLIVSTAEFDATLLYQNKLDLATKPTVTRGISRQSTLNRLMKQVISRELGGETEAVYDDWLAVNVPIVTVHPLENTPISKTRAVSLGSGVILQAHPIQADVRLTSVTQSTRDLGNHVLPPILRENPNITQPFQFIRSRGTDPGLSALELNNIDVNTISTVTRSQPLILNVDTPLAKGERVLAIAFDGDLYIPLGLGLPKGDKTEIKLERLPEPISEGNRSISGSIRIFFQKVISEILPWEYAYPILAIANVAEDQTVVYQVETQRIKEKVAASEKIVLYIHGIIGETESLVSSIKSTKVENGQSLADIYDLVLTFDYENLNTSIADNARFLKQRLEDIGLGVNHGKQLHIIAHSMGGLVSRWFIEREGGNKVVDHLILAGTPSLGSPWSNVQDFLTFGITVGLNSLSEVVWPVKILATLVGALEMIDLNLDDMKANSEFLKSLASSPDPKIPYTILAGNTSIITPPANSYNQRIMQKMFSSVVNFPFRGEANDIAVSVKSIAGVNMNRVPQPEVHEVACDHMTYFNSDVGQAALVSAVMQALRIKIAR